VKNGTSSPALTQSVTRALEILYCFSAEQPQLRVVDFAQKLSLTQSNVSRLVTTMVAMGYVEKDEVSGFYRLGLGILALAGIALNNYEIRAQALPELYELESKLELGANLAILRNEKMFYLAHVDSRKDPRMFTLIGHQQPLYCTGIGKVLLAHVPDEDAGKIISRIPYRPYTTMTITNVEDLERELDIIRKRGYSTEVEELRLGRGCLAAPIRDRSSRVVAGISVSGPLSDLRLSTRESELSQIVMDVATRISMKMGYMG